MSKHEEDPPRLAQISGRRIGLLMLGALAGLALVATFLVRGPTCLSAANLVALATGAAVAGWSVFSLVAEPKALRQKLELIRCTTPVLLHAVFEHTDNETSRYQVFLRGENVLEAGGSNWRCGLIQPLPRKLAHCDGRDLEVEVWFSPGFEPALLRFKGLIFALYQPRPVINRWDVN